MSNSIRKELIVNLCGKMQKIEIDYGEKLYNYIMKYDGDAFIKMDQDEFSSGDLKNIVDQESKIVGYYWIDNNENTLVLYTMYNCALNSFWRMMEIPEIDTIREYCEEVKEKGYTAKDARNYAANKYGANKERKFEKNPNNKPVNGKNIKFSRLTIKIKNEQDEEVGD